MHCALPQWRKEVNQKWKMSEEELASERCVEVYYERMFFRKCKEVEGGFQIKSSDTLCQMNVRPIQI